ncbi:MULTISPECIES: hypothetical protein [Enterobacteriaceae]|jgi:hypothetical protein|nr:MULTISPECIES: hypothetical protein [Enterobacteriaceae]MWF98363.1 hypothetical protein [Escherichia coli]CZW47161.1 Uncharacterised protein [Enterobacter cloacae]
MSAKDSFFKQVEENTNNQKASEEAFKKEVIAFQEDTQALISDIKSWFEGSPIQAATSTMQVTEDRDRFEVVTLKLHNGGKTLTINPEGFYYFGVTGCLSVSIYNPSRAPSTSKFSIHWKDTVSKISGWVIVSGGNGTPVQRIEFNQENFFKMISSFA